MNLYCTTTFVTKASLESHTLKDKTSAGLTCTPLCIEKRDILCFFRVFLYRSLLMKTLVPQKANDLFDAKDRSTAPEEFVRLFLMKEENAQLLETKTGNIDEIYLNTPTSIGGFDIISFVSKYSQVSN